jgi:peptidoglycan-associated lipoprotein
MTFPRVLPRIIMTRFAKVLTLLALAALAAGGFGCKRKPKNITPIPGYEQSGGSTGSNLTTGQPLTGNGSNSNRNTPAGRTFGNDGDGGSQNLKPNNGGEGIGGGLPPDDITQGKREDRDTFAGNSVYFQYDKSAVQSAEKAKLANVADYLKSNPASMLLVEGHCDERGTEGYNLALGEKRALSVREGLINLGVGADRITTVSLGEGRPADPGHGEAAYAKNRRAEFIVLLPGGSLN